MESRAYLEMSFRSIQCLTDDGRLDAAELQGRPSELDITLINKERNLKSYLHFDANDFSSSRQPKANSVCTCILPGFYSRNLQVVIGGAKRDRTADLNTASVALSQLSYSPKNGIRLCRKWRAFYAAIGGVSSNFCWARCADFVCKSTSYLNQ